VLERPKLHNTTEPFTSRLLGKGVSRTNALEALVISSRPPHSLDTWSLDTPARPRASTSRSTLRVDTPLT
jgi:hypothetical protein